MSANKIASSVITITSADCTNDQFGTGFVIHQNEGTAYVVTCHHVVETVGGRNKVIVSGKRAVVIVSGIDYGFDLDILKVEALKDRSSLRLHIAGEREEQIFILGAQLLSKEQGLYEKPPLEGKLGNQIEFESRDGNSRFNAWFLHLNDDTRIQRGYSGAPVINKKSGYVLAVASFAEEHGRTGRAISVEVIKRLWQCIPPDEFAAGISPNLFADELKSQVGIDYKLLSQLLSDRKWIEADTVTAYLMYKAQHPMKAAIGEGVIFTLEKTVDLSRSHVLPKLKEASEKNLPEGIKNTASGIKDVISHENLQPVRQYIKNSYEAIKDRYEQTEGAYLLVSEENSSLSLQDIKEFPLEDLYTIDRLWLKYSDGRFGFSVQKRIWSEITADKGINEYDAFYRFSQFVGWYFQRQALLSVRRVPSLRTFNPSNFTNQLLEINESMPLREGCFPY
jgi:hypothetical protein